MRILKSGMKFKSDTEYIASEQTIDVYLEDTFFCDNKEALSSSVRMGKSCQVGFLLENLENTVLDFNHAIVVFHGRIVPFILINCKNVTIKNLKIDYDRPFYTQADVLSVEKGKIEIKINDGFDYEIKDGYLYAKSESWQKNLNRFDCLLWMYDKTHIKSYGIILGLFGDEIFPNENPPMPILPLSIEEKDGIQTICGDFPAEWEYNNGNNILLITHEVRDKNTFTFVGGSDIAIENCILIHGGAMGIMGMHTHNITIDRYSMYFDYEGNGRMVTNNADAIHCFNCSGKFIIKNCHMEGLLDDTVNIHNNYFSVKEINKNVLTMYSKAAGLSINCKLFCEGDTIRVFRGRTQEAVTDLKITRVEIDEMNHVHYFTVEGDTSGISVDDTAENISAQPEIYIQNCTFGEFRGTMRLQSRNKTVVEDCVFANKNVALLFTGDTTYWYESGPVNDVTIRRCVFKNSNDEPRIAIFGEVEFTEKEKYYHKNILVEDCIFEDSVKIAQIRHTDHFVFRNNKCPDGSFIMAEECREVLSDVEVQYGKIN
ncbi:MAG: hypothetical protein E7397_02100 [Ruminococcaceae bacterium]|nr:hypothetical protein [Oscillospiraceae bacterium]